MHHAFFNAPRFHLTLRNQVAKPVWRSNTRVCVRNQKGVVALAVPVALAMAGLIGRWLFMRRKM